MEAPENDLAILGSGYRVGVYAQDEWRLADHLVATIGFRVDRNDVTGTKASPRVAMIWQPSKSSTFKALFGRSHRAPNAYERDYGDGLGQVPNPDLRGETFDTLELVADHRIGRSLALRASAYRWTMHAGITLGIDPVSGITQYQSGERVDGRGLELSADNSWNSGVRLRGSVSFQHVDEAGAGDVPNSPSRLGRVNLSIPILPAGLQAGLEWRYDGERLGIDGSRIGGYAVTNLNLSTDKLMDGLHVSLGIYNLFDKRYSHPGADSNWQNAFEQDGRSVRLKLGYRF